jgi:glycosyltransferase involved in cell wall biosynthesis
VSLRADVNLLWLAPGRVGGSEQYLARQLAGLPDGSAVRPRLYVQPAFVVAHPELSDRFETVPLPIDRDWRGLRVVAEHTWLWARTRGADLVHHGGGTLPVGARGPAVLTIHDLQYREFPEYFSQARLRYLERMMPHSARRAAVIATPSDFVRGTVIDAFGISPERVMTVLHGVPEPRRPTADAIAGVAERLGLAGRPYVVYPAITHPHKRHTLLIDAIARVPELALVLIGGQGAAEADVRSAIHRAGVSDRVVRPGRVTDAERDALVAGAAAMGFPSEYEGFGAPLVEAMLLGTPVVCSAHAAVREVVGGAAIVVEEPSPAAWAAALGEVAGGRTDLVDVGRERARHFTPECSGTALVAAYQRAVALGAPG